MNIDEICETYFENTVKKKHLYSFKRKTPKGNLIEGYICKKPNKFLGSIFLTYVNNKEVPQFIHSMPKINYYEYNTYEESIAVFHEKLDGSCLILYPIHDENENVIEIIPKTRNTVIADDYIVDLMKKTYTYPLKEFYNDEKETILIFELYGVGNKHEIYYPDSYVTLTLIGGYSIEYGVMLHDSLLDRIAYDYKMNRPKDLFTIVKDSFASFNYRIGNVHKSLELYKKIESENYPTFKDAIDAVKDYLTEINKISLEENGFILTEGAVANTIDKNSNQRYLKLKPWDIEEKHKNNKIPRRAILKEVRKYWDEYGSKVESIYQDDKLHCQNYVQKNLLEEFPEELVNKAQTKRKIESVFFNIWESKKPPAGIQEICHKLVDDNPDTELKDLMRIFAKEYPYKRKQANLVYGIMGKIKG